MSSYMILSPLKAIVGAGTVQHIGSETLALGHRAFLVTYRPGRFTATGIPEEVGNLLKMIGADVVSYGIEPEPSIATIDEGAQRCRKAQCDLVIGLGGGSALDAAKAIALLTKHDGSIRDYQMVEMKFEHPGLPVIAVPTTAGTGSESTKVSVITNKEAGVKKSVSHHLMVPEVAILDAELTVYLPPQLTATTGFDALSHALESYVSLNATPFSEALALKALELIGENLPRAVIHGADLMARSNMLIASYLAGLSLNAGVGAAHILAQPIGAVTGLSHSDSIAILLPHVVRANLRYSLEKYGRAATALGEKVDDLAAKAAGARIVRALERLLEETGQSQRLRDRGVTEADLDDILEVTLRSQMHIKTNPRPVDVSLLRCLLQEAF